jgi:hypothetical protein
VEHLACEPTAITLPNRRAVPQMALWLDLRPRMISSAQELGRYPVSVDAFSPVSRAVADQFVLDARDKDRTLPPPPSEHHAPTAHGRYWDFYGGCP